MATIHFIQQGKGGVGKSIDCPHPVSGAAPPGQRGRGF